MANQEQQLDARGMNFPPPVLRVKKAITGLSDGQVLRVLATDPKPVKDFGAFRNIGRLPVSAVPPYRPHIPHPHRAPHPLLPADPVSQDE